MKKLMCFNRVFLLCALFVSVLLGFIGSRNIVTATSAPIRIEMCNLNRSVSTNTINPCFILTNTSPSTLDLKDIKIRYYYTVNDDYYHGYVCDSAVVGSRDITASTTGRLDELSNPVNTADAYLEIGFISTAGQLAPWQSVQVQYRFWKTNWSVYTQSDDYSFNATATTPVEWAKVTGYVADALQWGIEPGTIKPEAPTSLVGGTSLHNAILAWNPPTDSSAIAKYNIYRNGTKIGSTTLTTYSDTNLANGSYDYCVTSVDSTGTESAFSNNYTLNLSGIEVFKNCDFESRNASEVPGWVQYGANMGTAVFTREATAGICGTACASLEFPRTEQNHRTRSWIQPIDLPAGDYVLRGVFKGQDLTTTSAAGLNVGAMVVANNQKYQSAPVTSATFGWTPFEIKFTVSGTVPDATRISLGNFGELTSGKLWFDNLILIPQQPVPAPTGLAGSISASNVILSWNPSLGAASYNIYCNSSKIASTRLTTWNQRSLVSGNYRFSIRAVDGLGNESAASAGESLNLDGYGAEPLKNGDFETRNGAWLFDTLSPAAYAMELTSGIANSAAPGIGYPTPAAAAAWNQKLHLAPGNYILRGFIKGNNLANGTGGPLKVGALINVNGFNNFNGTGETTGTFDWKPFETEFYVPDFVSGDVTVNLGNWDTISSGKVWFDNIQIVPDLLEMSSNKVVVRLEPTDWTALTAPNITRWLGHLDAAYLAFADLTGYPPFNGLKMEILSSHQDPAPGNGWVFGNAPIIYLHQTSLRGSLSICNSYDDWEGTCLHEMGHLFDSGLGPQNQGCGWNWHAEFWTHLKMNYVIETLNAKVNTSPDGTVSYTGIQINDYYRKGYVTGGVDSIDGLVYAFIRIKNIIGWQPFKDTFRYFVTTQVNPDTKLEKFNLFLAKLQEYYRPGGTEVESAFLSGELERIRANIDKYGYGGVD